MGFEEVATFRASGNVIFASPEREAEAKLAAWVEAELGERLGYEVPVFRRSRVGSSTGFPAAGSANRTSI
jgi:uncharacterized protein (DUF1697 family)